MTTVHARKKQALMIPLSRLLLFAGISAEVVYENDFSPRRLWCGSRQVVCQRRCDMTAVIR